MAQTELRPGLVEAWKQIVTTTKKATTLIKHLKLSEPMVSDFDFFQCAADNHALVIHSGKAQHLNFQETDYPFFAVCFLVGFVVMRTYYKGIFASLNSKKMPHKKTTTCVTCVSAKTAARSF